MTRFLGVAIVWDDVGIRASVGVFKNAPHLACAFTAVVLPWWVPIVGWCITRQCGQPTGCRYTLPTHRHTAVCPLAQHTPSGCGCGTM
jgi:hypothetical protein